MKTRMKKHVLTVLAATFASLFFGQSIRAQAPADVQTAFLQWAKKSLHPVSGTDLNSSTKDLAPVDKMIGDAKIVGMGEFVHAGAEPLTFRTGCSNILLSTKDSLRSRSNQASSKAGC